MPGRAAARSRLRDSPGDPPAAPHPGGDDPRLDDRVPRLDRRQRRPAGHPGGPRHRARRPAVGRRGLHADPGLAAAGRRLARGPFGRRRMFVGGLVGFGHHLGPLRDRADRRDAGRRAAPCRGSPARCSSRARWRSSPPAFEGEARGRAVGIWTAWAGISTLIGPAGGGLLVELDWRWIFWVNIPLIAVTVWVALRAVPESSDPDAVHGIDWLGIALSAFGLAGPVFALIEQPVYGFSDPIVWAPLAGGVACLVALRMVGVAHPRAGAAAGAVSHRTTSAPSTWRPCACTRRSAARSSSSPSSCSRSPGTPPSRPARRLPR